MHPARTLTTLASSLGGFARWAAPCLLLVLGSGCLTVTTYQPLVSLQRPVVVDPRLPNFEGSRVLIRCIPGDDLPAGDAQLLCRKLGALFRNQGAEVETRVPRAGRPGGRDEDEKPADLVLDVKSRLLHDEDSNLLAFLSVMTLTLVPTIEEQSFAQEVTIRDSSGSLLAADNYQSRFISYFGFGVWAVNWILDVLVRPPEEELTGDVANKEFSRDLYGQVSQLMFNAKVRRQVLRSFDQPPGSPPAFPPASPANPVITPASGTTPPSGPGTGSGAPSGTAPVMAPNAPPATGSEADWSTFEPPSGSPQKLQDKD